MCASLTPGFLYRCKTEHELRRETEQHLDYLISIKPKGGTEDVMLLDRRIYCRCIKYGVGRIYKNFYLVGSKAEYYKKVKELNK